MYLFKILFSSNVNVHIVARDRYYINAHTAHHKEKTKSQQHTEGDK
jgi:hypothetical protein